MSEPTITQRLTDPKLRGQIKVRREQQPDGTLHLVFCKRDHELHFRVDGDRLIPIDG